MERELEPIEHGHGTRCDLTADRQPVAMGALDLLEQGLPAARIERYVEQGEGERPAGQFDEPSQHGELGCTLRRRVREIVEELDHTLADAPHASGDRRQLFLAGGDGRCQGAVGRAVKQRARGRKAQRTRVEPFLDQSRHLGHVRRVGRLTVDAALAHHEDAQRRMGHLSGEVDVAVAIRQRLEIVGKTLPVPGHALAHYQLGNVLDAFHHLHQRVAILRAAGREADAAIAHQHRRHAMSRRGREAVVPGDLAVILGVDVDEARRHRETLGVDLLAACAFDAAHGGDPAVLNGNVGLARLGSGAIDHGAVAHHQIVLGCHGVLPRELLRGFASWLAPRSEEVRRRRENAGTLRPRRGGGVRVTR